MELALRRFSAEIDGADIALFYYSGHAAEVGALNYLLPTSAKIDGPRSLALDTIALQDISSAMRQAGAKVQLLFLDACRDNPFETAFAAPRAGGDDSRSRARRYGDRLADRVFHPARSGGAGRNGRNEPVHDRLCALRRAAEPRCSSGSEPCAFLRVEGHRQSAGALGHLVAGRRRQSGPEAAASEIRGATDGPVGSRRRGASVAPRGSGATGGRRSPGQDPTTPCCWAPDPRLARRRGGRSHPGCGFRPPRLRKHDAATGGFLQLPSGRCVGQLRLRLGLDHRKGQCPRATLPLRPRPQSLT